MSNFTQLNLPVFNNLYEQVNELIEKKVISWGDTNQICLNTTKDEPDNFFLGAGSLDYNWGDVKVITKNGNTEYIIPSKTLPYGEKDFSILCSQFKNTVFEEIYNVLSDNFTLGRIRLMNLKPKKCLSWHVDHTPRIHLPIKTQEGCLMVVENEVFHMEKNTWWMVDTTKKHTAFNSSKENRIHLVAVVL